MTSLLKRVQSSSRKQTWRARAFILSVACALALAGAQESTGAPEAREINASYRLGGQPTGTYHEATVFTGDGGSKTSIESALVFNRLGSKLEMKSRSEFQESRDGQLLAVASDQSSSEQVTHLDARVQDGSLAIKTTTGGKTYEHSVPFTGTLLGPEGARRLLVSRMHAAGDEISYQTFSPELGALVTISNKLVAYEDVTVGSEKIRSFKLEQAMSLLPGKSTVWLDQQGWLIRQVVPSPLGDIEAIRAGGTGEEAKAEAAKAVGASLPEETFTRSIVKANIRLPEERLVEAVRLKIVHKRPDLGWPELEADNQHVLEKTPNYVVLEVKRLQPKAQATRPEAKDAATAPYLAPNALLQSDDADIQQIANTVVGNERDSWRAAQALQRWTNDNMKFDPGIAIVSASEVAKNRRGTCFGYAMLLGSLARAADIPSRLRMGYVYAGRIWGGHAWIEVKVGEEWIPLDGALYSPASADAARFSFYTSALADGTLSGVGALGQLFSNVDIQILGYTVEGKRVDVPAGAEAFTIRGDEYRNPWLRFSIRKPAGFQFKDVDMTWPQSTLVAMEGPEGQMLKVENLSESLPTGAFDAEKALADRDIHGERKTLKVGGQSALAVEGEKAGTVVIDHGNVWVLTAAGRKAGGLLEATIKSVDLGN